MPEPTVKRVVATRVRNGRLEGLCVLSDGRQEWRPPTSVTAEAVNDRTGERRDLNAHATG